MGLFHLVLIVFLTVPLIEIFLFLEIGSWIGTLPTILLVVFTAVLGAALVRQQGMATLARMQEEVRRGEIPALELMEGAVVLMAGALLLTPGFFTDVIGLLFLAPPVRRYVLKKFIERYIKPRVLRHAGAAPPPRHDSIEGEYWRDD